MYKISAPLRLQMDDEELKHLEEIYSEFYFARIFFLKQNKSFLAYLSELILLELNENYPTLQGTEILYDGKVCPNDDIKKFSQQYQGNLLDAASLYHAAEQSLRG